jgi:hypothetical protein
MFSAEVGFPVLVMELALSRRGSTLRPVSDQVIAEQQEIADTFKGLGLIPAAINVSDAVRRLMTKHHYRHGPPVRSTAAIVSVS